VDTEAEPGVQDDFRRRAVLAQILLLPIAVVVFFTSRRGAPEMFESLRMWWAPLVLAWTGVSAVAATAALWARWFRVARAAAIAEVTSILLGWCLGQYPYLIYPDLTVRNSAAPEVTLRLLVLALGLGAVILLPCLYYLFHVFKGQRADGAG
jgi:cytochrome d ubiquinol oxidase subunit II